MDALEMLALAEFSSFMLLSDPQKLFTLGIPLESLNNAKVALKRAGHKLPTPTWIVVETRRELIQ